MAAITDLQRLPLNLPDFIALRECGMIYVDKTRQIASLAMMRRQYVFVRPRRFAKSDAITLFALTSQRFVTLILLSPLPFSLSAFWTTPLVNTDSILSMAKIDSFILRSIAGSRLSLGRAWFFWLTNTMRRWRRWLTPRSSSSRSGGSSLPSTPSARAMLRSSVFSSWRASPNSIRQIVVRNSMIWLIFPSIPCTAILLGSRNLRSGSTFLRISKMQPRRWGFQKTERFRSCASTMAAIASMRMPLSTCIPLGLCWISWLDPIEGFGAIGSNQADRFLFCAGTSRTMRSGVRPIMR